MSSLDVYEIVPGVFWVGAENWNRRTAYGLIHLPLGDSANAYLVVGKSKVALIDTVYPGFDKKLLSKIEKIINPKEIDYVIMNHAEPDHGGSIAAVLSTAENAKLVLTKFGAEMAQALYDVPSERMMVVKEGDTLDLGEKTLRFLDAPWLHWPETMFTYCVEDRVLFSCDFFGTHMAKSRLYDDEVGDRLMPQARDYYAFVLMPYLLSVKRALDKVKELNVNIIAPSHGPIYRNPKRIVSAYEQWVRGPLKPKAVVAYVSMWGKTETLAEATIHSLSAEGIEVVPHNLLTADITHILSDLVDASAIIIGSPTFVNGIHPVAMEFVQIIQAYKPRGKIAGVFGSYGWGHVAVTQIKDVLERSGFEVADTMEVRGKPKEDDLKRAAEFGRHLAQRIKESLKAV